MKIAIDKSNRVVIPKRIREELNIKDFVFLEVEDNKIILMPDNGKSAKDLIENRLKGGKISNGEKNFLKNLLKYI